MKKQPSVQWQNICHVTILDPDGWDRHNYTMSWYVDFITRKEFEKRMIESTVQSSVTWDSCIWKDQPYRMFWYIKKQYREIKDTLKPLFERKELK